MMMLLFTFLVLLALTLHFVFAYREWRRGRGRAAGEIDIHYVRLEDYLGRSFRQKVDDWIVSAPADSTVVYSAGRNDRVQLTDALELPERSSVHVVLVVRGDCSAGASAVLAKEIYVHGACSVGQSSTVRAMAVDGNLTLHPGVRVERWLDCRGSIDAARECNLGQRVTAAGEVRLELGASAVSIAAPTITVLPARDEDPPQADVDEPFVITPDEGAQPAAMERAGIEARRLRRMSSDTWVYNGSFKPAVPVHTTVKLLVRGDCRVLPGSVLHDCKVNGRFEIGAACRCEGPLVAAGDMVVGEDTLFFGPLLAGGGIRLRSGARGGRPGREVAVYAARGLEMESGVIVHGKVASGTSVSATAQHPQQRDSREAARAATADRSTRAGILAVALALAFAPRVSWCQAADPADRPLPVRLELGMFGSQVNNGFGDWRGASAQVWLRSIPRFIPAFTVETQLRPLGRQQNYAFFSYANWTSNFYTVQGASYAPQQDGPLAIYYPRDREDIKAYWKVGRTRRIVLGAGFTRFNFGTPGRGQIYNPGILIYRKKLVFEGNLFVNRNQPRNLFSASGTVAAQYGVEGRYWAGITAGGGRELYNYVGVAPFDVKLFSYSLQGFYRKWLSRHVGFKFSLLYLQKLEAYRQVGAVAGLFFEM